MAHEEEEEEEESFNKHQARFVLAAITRPSCKTQLIISVMDLQSVQPKINISVLQSELSQGYVRQEQLHLGQKLSGERLDGQKLSGDKWGCCCPAIDYYTGVRTWTLAGYRHK